MLLPLKGCDIVLRIQWLIKLGPILWDFEQLCTEFCYLEQNLVLRCSQKASLTVIEGRELMKMVSTITSCSPVHLCSIHMANLEATQADLGEAAESQREIGCSICQKTTIAEPQGLPQARA